MGALKQLSQPVTNEYLKVTENCAVSHVAGSVAEDGTVTPASIRFVIGYTVFESYQARLDSETNKWVKQEPGTITVNSLPLLPDNWQPVNPAKAEAEKLTAMAYLALLAHPDFAGWVTYQP